MRKEIEKVKVQEKDKLVDERMRVNKWNWMKKRRREGVNE